MPDLVNDIILELKQNLDPKYREGERRFFKEKIKNIGVRVPERRKVAQKFWLEIKKLSKQELFKLADKMYQKGYNELTTIANSWIWHRREEFRAEDFEVFEGWVAKYFDNWAKVDDFCTHSLGCLINKYPKLIKKLTAWTKSKNRWVKRAGAVALIFPFHQQKKFLAEIFIVAEKLLTDIDQMVQKGYGWMLKEASVRNQKEVFNFVMKHKAKMPRTALRYAIELMPEKLKKKAMG